MDASRLDIDRLVLVGGRAGVQRYLSSVRIVARFSSSRETEPVVLRTRETPVCSALVHVGAVTLHRYARRMESDFWFRISVFAGAALTVALAVALTIMK
jgi:hypothetical protein